MSKTQGGGWPSLFRPKTNGARVQGWLTAKGAQMFEQARKRLAKLADRPKISDADVIEYLSRGEVDTVLYLKKRP